MRLSSAIMVLLRQVVAEVVSDDDLELTYAFVHELNGRREMRRILPLANRPGIRWEIFFFSPEEQPLLDGWLARFITNSLPLERGKGERGLLVHNAWIELLPQYRLRGFARALYASEERLYRRWGVREVHIHAQKDGPVVWVKHFDFDVADREQLAADWRSWASRHGHPATMPDLAMLPREFLSRYDDLHLIKVLE
jgi:GNAT superfamily N-acetyltransferase